MTLIVPLAGRPDLLSQVLDLNAAHERETGPLDRTALRGLLAEALAAPAALDDDGLLLGFLLCLPEGAPYDSPNFRWVADRLRRFAYVDRVIVAPQARGCGVGRALYAAAERHARGAGLSWLACEVNLDPPNPVSDRFHAALGFITIGVAHQPSRAKTMRYLARPLETDP